MKKKILGICGSASEKSGNLSLLKAMAHEFSVDFDWVITNELRNFPLFRPEDLEKDIPDCIKVFKDQLLYVDAIVIVTPEYTHNIPAVLKNALEWCTASGEFANKPIIPITFTPAEPRGKYAMKSLLESLKTLGTNVVTEMSLYRTDVQFDDYNVTLNSQQKETLEIAIGLL